MKHAINELKVLLDTWGPQKEQNWKDSMNDAINVLSAEQHRADMDANSGPEDDDLGELDPSAACKLDNPECESCS